MTGLGEQRVSVPRGSPLRSDKQKHGTRQMTLDPNKIYKVFHSLFYQDRSEGIFITDLQYDEPDWYLVFEWSDRGEGDYPSLRYPIEISRLRAAQSSAHDFVIENPVEIPESEAMTEMIRNAKAGKEEA